MTQNGLSDFVAKVWHIKAMTLNLRSRSFWHKSRYLSYLTPGLMIWKAWSYDILRRYDHLTLTSMSRSNFNGKLKYLVFCVLTTNFAVSLLGIVIKGRKWCRRLVIAEGYCLVIMLPLHLVKLYPLSENVSVCLPPASAYHCDSTVVLLLYSVN